MQRYFRRKHLLATGVLFLSHNICSKRCTPGGAGCWTKANNSPYKSSACCTGFLPTQVGNAGADAGEPGHMMVGMKLNGAERWKADTSSCTLCLSSDAVDSRRRGELALMRASLAP